MILADSSIWDVLIPSIVNALIGVCLAFGYWIKSKADGVKAEARAQELKNEAERRAQQVVTEARSAADKVAATLARTSSTINEKLDEQTQTINATHTLVNGATAKQLAALVIATSSAADKVNTPEARLAAADAVAAFDRHMEKIGAAARAVGAYRVAKD